MANIQIPDDHVPALVEYYRTKNGELAARIAELQKEQQQNEAIISNLLGKSNLNTSVKTFVSGSYDRNWTWRFKINYVLQEANKPLTSSAIVDRIVELDQTPDKRKEVMKSISAMLTSTTSTYRKIESEGMQTQYAA